MTSAVDGTNEQARGIASMMRASIAARSLSRRRVIQVAGIGGTAAVLAACGAGGDEGSGTASAAASAQDLSDTDKTMNWSNWPLYMDEDDAGNMPTLLAFEKASGIDVTYTADVNDNNEFFAKVRTQLEQGQDIGRDIVVLTDWMAGLWIGNGYAQKLDKTVIPNWENLSATYRDVSFDPGREYSLPWQSGFGAFGWNKAKLNDALGTDTLVSLNQLWDPALKGRITVLSEMRDTMGIIMSWQGADPTNFTEDQWNAAIEELTKQIDNGQIRQVAGNDYIAAMESGDVIAVIGWSGDMFQLGPDFGVGLPETGGTLWTDNMLIPPLAQHKKNAELTMNNYYDPEVAAQVAAWVQYICPVGGAKEAMEKIDPTLVSNPWIFPTEVELSNSAVFMSLTDAQNEQYQRDFQKAIGN